MLFHMKCRTNLNFPHGNLLFPAELLRSTVMSVSVCVFISPEPHVQSSSIFCAVSLSTIVFFNSEIVTDRRNFLVASSVSYCVRDAGDRNFQLTINNAHVRYLSFSYHVVLVTSVLLFVSTSAWTQFFIGCSIPPRLCLCVTNI